MILYNTEGILNPYFSPCDNIVFDPIPLIPTFNVLLKERTGVTFKNINLRPGTCFSNVPITFRAWKAVLCAWCLHLGIQILLVFESKQ